MQIILSEGNYQLIDVTINSNFYLPADDKLVRAFNLKMPPAKALVLFLLLIDCSDSKVLIIIYEDYERCVEPEEEAGKLDFSDLHIIALSDTKVYLNGSVKFLKDINAPWRIFAFGERFIRNKWLMDSIHRKVSDLCQSIQSPLEPWYFITSKFEHKNCPFPAGVISSIITRFSHEIH